MITAGSIFKLAVPAVKKAGTLAFQKISRLQAINDALDDVSEDALAKKIIEDFEIVKGSWKGEFTTTVDGFLRAFEASGLDVAMINSALIQARSQSTSDAFVALFVSETGQAHSNGLMLYDQVAKSFEVSAALLTQDPVMARMVRTSHATLAGSITKLESAIESVRLGIERRPTSDELTEIIPRIIRSVAGDTKHIRVETSQGPKEIEISKIYIPPRLRMRDFDEVRNTLKVVVESLPAQGRSKRDMYASVSQEVNRLEHEISSITIADVANISKTVVLGNPGGGKSTLLQSVCQKIAVDALRAIADGTPCSDVKVPLRIVLRDYEHARLGNSQLSILEYIANDLLSAAYADKSVLTRCIENMLATGRAYLAFDGLDEILKTANRRQFVDIVNRFVRQYPLCQVLVTSREVGYDNAPLAAGEYEELVLGDFIDADVKLYAERFIRHLGRKKVAEAREAASHFMSQTAQNASDLRRNPLMLGLMMWIFNIRDDVPSNRPEIYQECARLMFERWDGDRNIIVDLPQTFDRLQVFAYIASKLFEDEDLSSGVDSRWIEREIRLHLSEVLESVPQAQAAAASLVQFIVDRSWVMSEKGDGVFAFTHQTFLEYFFAKFNDDAFDTVSALFDNLHPHIIQDEWDVVSRLALQIKTHRNRRRQDEAVDCLIGALSSGNINDEGRRALAGFSVRCLEFLIGSEAKVRSLVETTLLAMLTCYKAGTIEVMDAVPLIFSGAKERRTFVGNAVEEWLVARFASDIDEDRDFVIAFIDGVTRRYGTFGDVQGSCASVPDIYIKKLRGKIIPTLLDEASVKQKSAKVLFEWTGTIPKSSLEKFGLAFVHYARSESAINVDGLSGLALAASGKYSEFFTKFGLSRQKAESSLRAIGSYARRHNLTSIAPFSHVEGLNNPPGGIWVRLLKAMKSDADLRLGACVASFCESRNFGPRGDDSEHQAYANELRRQASIAAGSGNHDAAQIITLLWKKYIEANALAAVVEPEPA